MKLQLDSIKTLSRSDTYHKVMRQSNRCDLRDRLLCFTSASSRFFALDPFGYFIYLVFNLSLTVMSAFPSKMLPQPGLRISTNSSANPIPQTSSFGLVSSSSLSPVSSKRLRRSAFYEYLQ